MTCARADSRTMPTPSTEDPELLDTPAALRRWSVACHAEGMSVGMVPTMGALHAGHRGLIDRAMAENDRVVVTIFVNPAQFGPSEDFARYPRKLEADLEVVAAAGVHAAFVPSVAALLVAGLPDRAYFGQKDAQQVAVVRHLADDLETGVDIVVCPTVRDTDGLAISSRNVYLSQEDRL